MNRPASFAPEVLHHGERFRTLGLPTNHTVRS
jgi:hypothetical protein